MALMTWIRLLELTLGLQFTCERLIRRWVPDLVISLRRISSARPVEQ
jgi:hypothetical protein